ncbi:unnamed protein product, partial [Prorocentrum cordatum]
GIHADLRQFNARAACCSPIVCLHCLPHTMSRNDSGTESRKQVIFRLRNKRQQPRIVHEGLSPCPDRTLLGGWREYEAGNDPFARSRHHLLNMWDNWDGMQEVVARESHTGWSTWRYRARRPAECSRARRHRHSDTCLLWYTWALGSVPQGPGRHSERGTPLRGCSRASYRKPSSESPRRRATLLESPPAFAEGPASLGRLLRDALPRHGSSVLRVPRTADALRLCRCGLGARYSVVSRQVLS